MSAPPPVAAGNSLINRVKAIVVQPATEWQTIAGEPATVGSIYTGYIAILAAIPAICGAVWRGRDFGGSGVRFAIVTYILLGLLFPFVMALIIDALATSFGGTKNQVQALKVSAYASTPYWVVGILYLIPGTWLIDLARLLGGLYSLYLLYLGLPVLMKAPADRAVGYTVVTVCLAIVAYAIIGVAIGGALLGGSVYPSYR